MGKNYLKPSMYFTRPSSLPNPRPVELAQPRIITEEQGNLLKKARAYLRGDDETHEANLDQKLRLKVIRNLYRILMVNTLMLEKMMRMDANVPIMRDATG